MRKSFLIAWALLLFLGAAVIWLYPRAVTIVPAVPELEQRTSRYFESIRSRPAELLEFLRKMPKGGDLHTHLSGAVYAETFVTWAAGAKMCVDPITFELSRQCKQGQVKLSDDLNKNDPVFYRHMIDAWSVRNWEHSGKTGHDQFFESFKKFGAVSDRIGEMLAEVRARAAAGNLSYLEVMLTPDGGSSKQLAEKLKWNSDFPEMRNVLLKQGLIDSAVNTSVQNLNAAENKMNSVLRCDQPQPADGCKVQIRYIFQVGRTGAPAQVFAQMLTAFELANIDARVVALNLVQPEDNEIARNDFSLHMQMLDYFRSIYNRAHITLHAGELTPGLVPPQALKFHIRDSVNIGHAERIGHGVDLIQEDNWEQLLREMAERKVMVEICLTSNDVILKISKRDHPFRKYVESGVPVALATDDEGIARSEITREYLKAVEDQGVNYSELKRMARATLEHAFISGKSLWQSESSFTLVAQCARDKVDLPPLADCQEFLKANERADLQWQLEKSLAEFERLNQ
jgi:adenosine deaminase